MRPAALPDSKQDSKVFKDSSMLTSSATLIMLTQSSIMPFWHSSNCTGMVYPSYIQQNRVYWHTFFFIALYAECSFYWQYISQWKNHILVSKTSASSRYKSQVKSPLLELAYFTITSPKVFLGIF